VPYVRVNDLDCWYEDDWFGEPWTSDPEVIVMQPGYAANAAHLQAWVPGLAGGYRVIRRDSIGHGRTSAGEPDHDISLGGLANDTIAFLDALGLDRVHYFGERTGGMTGITLAARYPERLISLSVLGTPTRCGKALQDAMHAKLPSHLQARYTGWNDAIRGEGGIFAWFDLVGWLQTSDAQKSRWQREQARLCDPDLLERYAEATKTFDVAEHLAQVTTPTLIFAPTASYRTGLADQLTLRQTMPNAQIEVVEGSGGRPDDVPAGPLADRLRRFLDSVSPSRRG
jgi:pimeloyl-ACP methyl ester carboxylesterase